MPTKAYFLDTNVLVYAYTSRSDAKSDIANALITSGEAMVSAQVLNEFCNTIRRKFAVMCANIDTALDELVSVLPVAHRKSIFAVLSAGCSCNALGCRGKANNHLTVHNSSSSNCPPSLKCTFCASAAEPK